MDENTPLLQPTPTRQTTGDSENAFPRRSSTSSMLGTGKATISALADALAIDIYNRDPNPVLFATSDEMAPRSASNPLLEMYAPILQAHRVTIGQAFPPSFSRPRANSRVEEPVLSPLDDDQDAQGSRCNPTPQSAAFLLCAALTLLERSTALRDPPSRGELGVEKAIRSRATREKLQQSLADLAVNLLDEPLSGNHFVSPPPEPLIRDEQDESVTVLWSEWTVDQDQSASECAVDILIRILNGPFATRYETICYPLLAHPVLLASADYVWTNGLYLDSSNWTKRLLRPSLLHFHALVFYAAWVFLTFYIALESDFKHLYHFNPLTPKHGYQTAGQGVAWYFFLVFAIGHAFETIRIFLSARIASGCGPPLIGDTFVVFAVFLRICRLQADFAYVILSYSLPLLLLSLFVFPSIPSLALLTKYRLPRSRLALQTVTTRLEGLAQVFFYLVFSLAALGWAMSGDVNIQNPWLTIVSAPISVTNTIAPIEARTSIAGGILLGLVLAWMLGDAYGAAPRRLSSSDADGFEAEYGRSIALSARSSHLQATRYYLPRYPFHLPPPLNLINFFLTTLPLAVLSAIPPSQRVPGLPRIIHVWSSKVAIAQAYLLLPVLFLLDSLEKFMKILLKST